MRTGPDYIQLYPLLRCNRSCAFCYNQSMPFMEDMQLIDFRSLAKRLRGWPVRTIDLMGGEPTIHSDIVPLLQAAIAQGLRVNVSSNATNLPLLKKMSSLGDQVAVGISINDRATLKATRTFIRSHRPIVKTIYTPHLDPGFVQKILESEPKTFYLIYPDALEREGLAGTISFDQFFPAVPDSFGVKSVGTVFCSGFIPDAAAYPDLATARCPAGTTKLGIMPDGSVYPCNLFFGKKDFLLGNILTDPLDAIWHHPALSFFRTFTGNACPRRTCDLHAVCHGGCPAHSFAHRGSVAAPEPRCQQYGSTKQPSTQKNATKRFPQARAIR